MIIHLNTLSSYDHKVHVFKKVPKFIEIYFSKFSAWRWSQIPVSENIFLYKNAFQ